VIRRTGRTPFAADHARARDLAAERLDETLAAPDAAFLDAHLASCAECRDVAAEYQAQRVSLRSLRAIAPEPPRDLWARTAAALESEARRSPGGRRDLSTRPPRFARTGRLTLAPLAAVMVVAIVVGAGLLSGHGVLPAGTTTGPTPIALAAADLQVISRADDGSVQIYTRSVNAVCPVSAAACGVSPSFAVTAVTGLSGSADLNGILSPSRDRMIVVERGSGAQGVYVFPVVTTTPAASSTTAPATTSSATPASGSAGPDATATAIVPTATPTATATVTAATPTPAGPTPEPSPSVTPGTDSSPSPSPSPVVTVEPATPAPVPSVRVSPAPGGAIEIASGVTVVGVAAYSPDGTRFAFSARPSDGSTGPDVYVWTVGETHARAVTTDHATQFAAWTAAGLLVSRVTDGTPASDLLDPETGVLTPVGPGSVWLPVVDPTGHVAAWWDGTVKLAPDGVTWLPDAGRLVLGKWPPVAVGARQVLTEGPLAAWDVRWDEGDSVVAVWLAGSRPGKPGRLSLYPVDAGTGLADLAHPMLDAVPAAQGFSLKSGRLAWSVPGNGGDGTLQVLAWTGTNVGRLEIPAEQGSTVVP
jgi:hypothetical protein